MSSPPIKLGIIGIGGYAREHVRSARTLEASGQCKLVAVADPIAERNADLVESLKESGVEILHEPLKLLERGDIDAVIISSPIHHHASQAIAALRAGKHVYLEKPPCPTLGEWAQIVDARNSSRRICAIGFQMQMMPGVSLIKRRMLAGELGEIRAVWSSLACCRDDAYYARSPWSGRMTVDGAAVFDGPATNAIAHIVHMAGYLAGASEDGWAKIARVRGSLLRARPIESYDTSYIEAETSSGLPIRLAFTHATGRGDLPCVRVQGAVESAMIDWSGRVTFTPAGGETSPPRTLQYDFDPEFAAMIEFFQAIREPESKRVTTRIDDTLAYLQMVNGALQSSGGVHSFPNDQIERVNEPKPPHYFRVKGLDESLSAFAEDPTKTPALLATRPMPWIAGADISPRLTVE